MICYWCQLKQRFTWHSKITAEKNFLKCSWNIQKFALFIKSFPKIWKINYPSDTSRRSLLWVYISVETHTDCICVRNIYFYLFFFFKYTCHDQYQKQTNKSKTLQAFLTYSPFESLNIRKDIWFNSQCELLPKRSVFWCFQGDL